MKAILSLMLLLGLALPVLGAEKKTSSKKPAESSKKKEAEAKPSKAEAEAGSLTAAQKTKLLKTINEGDDKTLIGLPGVGETIAAAIKKARPVKEVADLLKIDGIGEATYSELIKYAKAGASSTKKEGSTKPKTTKKKTT